MQLFSRNQFINMSFQEREKWQTELKKEDLHLERSYWWGWIDSVSGQRCESSLHQGAPWMPVETCPRRADTCRHTHSTLTVGRRAVSRVYYRVVYLTNKDLSPAPSHLDKLEGLFLEIIPEAVVNPKTQQFQRWLRAKKVMCWHVEVIHEA